MTVAETLKLELQIVVSHHVGARKQTVVLWKRYKCSKLLSSLSSPHPQHIFRTPEVGIRARKKVQLVRACQG